MKPLYLRVCRPMLVKVFAGIVAGILISTADVTHAFPQVRPQFEVASIKPDHSEDAGTMMEFPLGGFRVVNITPKSLIQYAYNLKEFQISGGPGWADSKTFDIHAKLEDADIQALQQLSPEQRAEQIRLRVQALLADRFKLKVTHTAREGQVYALVVAKGGCKMESAETKDYSGTSMGLGRMTGGAIPVATLADMLSQELGRPVEDHTGLTGKYNFKLRWAPDLNAEAITEARAGNPTRTSNSAAGDTSLPSLFTAIQEQLGLKLELMKAPIEIIVIDHIEPPTEN